MKKSFSCWMSGFTLTLALFCLDGHAAAQAGGSTSVRIDMTGSVMTAEGEPIPGAMVWIYTAGPRIGVGFL